MIETSSYSVFLAWSEADEAYIANVFELPGCMAHGETRGEAIAQIEIAIENWLEAAKELGREIPQPRHLEAYEQEVEARTEETRQELVTAWKKTMQEALPELVEDVAEHLSKTSQYVLVVRDERGGFRFLFDDPRAGRMGLRRSNVTEKK